MGIDYEIEGEQANFPCSGYILDINPIDNDPQTFVEQINSHLTLLFGESARGLNLEMTIYSPRANWWTHVQILYEYGIQGEQVLSRPSANFQTFRLNIYQTFSDTSDLELKEDDEQWGLVLLIFDSVKLALYTLYFGKQQINDVQNFMKKKLLADFSDYFLIIWNSLVSFMNISNFVLFLILSRGYDVNEILRENKFLDSNSMSSFYQSAQLFDSILIIMNMLMLIQFTTISRRVSLIMKIIGITSPYLFYLVISYLLMLYMMAMIVWQVWGDKLSYFRNIPISMIYTLALFDLKTMYLGKDFMAANQYGVPGFWLFILIVLFAIVLHYSVTLQYSAYFHIYFTISQKYEEKVAVHELKKQDVLKVWLKGFLKNPFSHEEEEESLAKKAKSKAIKE